MQGNTTEIDERNLLRLDALLSHGYGLSPQLVMRSKGLSIEANSPSSRERNTKASSGLPTLNDGLSDRTNFGYSDSVNGIVTGNPWNFD